MGGCASRPKDADLIAAPQPPPTEVTPNDSHHISQGNDNGVEGASEKAAPLVDLSEPEPQQEGVVDSSKVAVEAVQDPVSTQVVANLATELTVHEKVEEEATVTATATAEESEAKADTDTNTKEPPKAAETLESDAASTTSEVKTGAQPPVAL